MQNSNQTALGADGNDTVYQFGGQEAFTQYADGGEGNKQFIQVGGNGTDVMEIYGGSKTAHIEQYGGGWGEGKLSALSAIVQSK